MSRERVSIERVPASSRKRSRARAAVEPAIWRRIDARLHAPPDDLADVVAACWSALWDLRGGEAYLAEAFAEPSVHIVLERGASRVVGPSAGPIQRTLGGRGALRAVKLRAGAARVLVPIAAARVANRALPLGSAFGLDGSSVARLEREVLGPLDDREAFERLAEWLRARRDVTRSEPARTAMALVDQIAIDVTIVSVTRLARAVRLTPRALDALFREHVGLTPKWLIRRARLYEAALRIARGEPDKLGKLRRELGYTSLTQLSRDMKRASGKSVKELLDPG